MIFYLYFIFYVFICPVPYVTIFLHMMLVVNGIIVNFVIWVVDINPIKIMEYVLLNIKKYVNIIHNKAILRGNGGQPPLDHTRQKVQVEAPHWNRQHQSQDGVLQGEHLHLYPFHAQEHRHHLHPIYHLMVHPPNLSYHPLHHLLRPFRLFPYLHFHVLNPFRTHYTRWVPHHDFTLIIFNL